MLAERLTAQLLAGPPAADPVEVVRRLLSVQGQDPRGARLAIRARSTGLSAADVDRALTAHRSLLVTWLNRGTLHLVASEDYPWLHPLTDESVVTVNGLFRPFALVRGRAVATWSIEAGDVVLRPFGRLTHADQRALRGDALDVTRFPG